MKNTKKRMHKFWTQGAMALTQHTTQKMCIKPNELGQNNPVCVLSIIYLALGCQISQEWSFYNPAICFRVYRLSLPGMHTMQLCKQLPVAHYSTAAQSRLLMLASYLTGGKGFDVPQKLRDILDGHLETEAVSFEEQHRGLLEKLTSSTGFSSNHSL